MRAPGATTTSATTTRSVQTNNEKGPHAITRTAYYDGIAKQWHRATGHHGGALKRYLLNDLILSRIDGVAGRAILELGAGNGYFAPLLLRRFGGQPPARLVISDQSRALLDIAQSTFRVDGAEYLALDVQETFPFADATFDLVLASMLFNELPTSSLQFAAGECYRVLKPGGRLLAAVVHPDLVHALGRKAQLTDFGRGLAAMPSAEGLRLPVSRRRSDAYLATLEASGFRVRADDVHPDDKVLREKPGLKVSRGTPLALLLDGAKT